MNTKRWLITSLVVFVVAQILEFIIHAVILSGIYETTAHLWRSESEMNSMMWIMWLSGLIWAFLFVYIFIKGYEGRGIMEGVRFGLIIGLFFSIPMSLGSYAAQPIPFSLAVYWFIFGVIEIVILGVVTALLYKPVQPPISETDAA
ncbi:MAG: DUF1761 domain-containing protein [Calditrichaeota bacterium]|nr:DUF1761 domain-containing protein [Calditrichota bacterium]